jgi:hypothetical protein
MGPELRGGEAIIIRILKKAATLRRRLCKTIILSKRYSRRDCQYLYYYCYRSIVRKKAI